MALKPLGDSRLFTIRDSGKSFLISLLASSRCSKSYLDSLELSVALLADYGESKGWQNISLLITGHLQEYDPTPMVRGARKDAGAALPVLHRKPIPAIEAVL